MFFLQGNIFSAKINDSMVIRDSMSPENEGISNVFSKMVNAVTFRTALNAVGKNSKNMSSKLCKQEFSTMQNVDAI